MKIRRILVPLDGSAHADRAVELAADLAARYDAGLSLLHVYHQGFVPEEIRALSDKPGSAEAPLVLGASPLAMGDAAIEPSLPKEVIEDIGETLLARARKAAETAGAKKVETTAVWGSPAEAILDHAQGADLIVMGSRGLGRLKGLVLGSVSHKVQSLAGCSVVIVK